MSHWRNKDTKGALMLVWLVFAVTYLLLVAGCTVTPGYRPTMELGMHYQPRKEVFGDNPVGTVRLKQPVWVSEPQSCSSPALWLEYEHHSSIPNNDDLAVTDQVGVMFRIPLGRTK